VLCAGRGANEAGDIPGKSWPQESPMPKVQQPLLCTLSWWKERKSRRCICLQKLQHHLQPF